MNVIGQCNDQLIDQLINQLISRMNLIGQHNDQLINQLIVSWMWLVNVMISWLISWSISWLVEWTWLVSWLISWLVEWTWLVSWLDLPKFSRTCPNLLEFAQACFRAVAPVGEDDLWGIWSKLLTEENLNYEKCDRQKTKKILPMRDFISTFYWRNS